MQAPPVVRKPKIGNREPAPPRGVFSDSGRHPDATRNPDILTHIYCHYVQGLRLIPVTACNSGDCRMKIVLLNIIELISTGFLHIGIISGCIPGFPGVPGTGERGNSRGNGNRGIVPETYPHPPPIHS